MLAEPERDHLQLDCTDAAHGRESIVRKVRRSGPDLELETVQFLPASLRIRFSRRGGSIRSTAKGGVSKDFGVNKRYGVD
jgi:hypothetical protein